MPDRLGLGPHRQRRAEIANQRRDDVAPPRAVGSAEGGAAAQPDRAGIDRLLPERAEALSLKRHALVPHLISDEERLQAVVGRARQEHSPQDLDALVACERCGDRLAATESVAVPRELLPRLVEALLDRSAGRRFRKSFGRSSGELSRERAREEGAQRLDRCGIPARVGRADRLKGEHGGPDGKRMSLGDE